MRNAFRTGNRIYFRPLELPDLEFLQSLVNDEALQPFLAVYWPMNGVSEREWLEGLYKSRDKFAFGIVLKEEERLIGSCELRLAAGPHRSADLGIALAGAGYQGKGYGSEALGLLLAYGFETLGLHRITLSVYENNARGIRCYEKCGFRREGVRRQARWWAGRWWDILDYAILETEWHTLSPLRPSELGFGGQAPRNAAK